MPVEKTRVAVLYGGRSGEHEVSLVSAASVVRNLDKSRFDVLPIAIDKSGRWLLHDVKQIDPSAKALPVCHDALAVLLPAFPQTGGAQLLAMNPSADRALPKIDVVFPVMHGPLCEDGTIQGMLELADVAYVGCGVVGSAVGMDKDVSKRLAQAAGVTVVPWLTVKAGAYEKDPEALHAQVAKMLGFPCFVKPANMGSSVGVVKVKSPGELPAAMKLALSYDTKVLVEKAINCREIEVGVLESLDASAAPLTSIPGEIVPSHEFYSYQAKYLDENGAALKLPTDLPVQQQAIVRQMAADVFTALEGEGLTRCDFLLCKDSGTFYFNEVNTMPGFTSISMYPKLMEATGVPYGQLLTHLIELALKKQARRASLCRDFAGANA